MPKKYKNARMFLINETMTKCFKTGGKCLKMTQKIMTKCLKRTKNDKMFQKEQKNASKRKVTYFRLLFAPFREGTGGACIEKKLLLRNMICYPPHRIERVRGRKQF
jgi:hypothetical protein